MYAIYNISITNVFSIGKTNQDKVEDGNESKCTSSKVVTDALPILYNESYDEVKESQDLQFYVHEFDKSAGDHTIERQTVESILTQQMIEILVGIRPNKEFR